MADTLTLHRSQVAALIEEFHEGHIFTVTFRKRSTGEIRVMNARKGVKKHLRGGPAAYNPQAHALIWCFDVQKGEYRSIAIEGIISLKMDGTLYTITEAAHDSSSANRAQESENA